MSANLPRRAFLTRLGGAALCAAVAPACRAAAGAPALPGGLAGTADAGADAPTPAADLAAQAADSAATGSAWADLRSTLKGKLFTPADSGYGDARLLFNTRFDGMLPQGVARCLDASDVQACVLWAQKQAIPLAIRSGGHSYAGFSSGGGLVVDVRGLAQIDLLPGNQVRAGAGCQMIDVYTALSAKGLLIPGGSCPTMGISGHALGGGFGLSSRQFGMLSDTLVAVDIVTAAGDLLTVNSKDHPDLLWACQGGGGGSFGVVTALTFQAQPIPKDVSWFAISWPWSDAAAVLQAWQTWAPAAPPALTSLCHLFAGSDYGAQPGVSIVGQFFGTTVDCQTLLQTMLAVGKPSKPTIEQKAFADLTLFWADCTSLAACHLAPAGGIQRDNYRAKSDYMTQPVPAAGIAAMLQSMEERQKFTSLGAVLLDAHGGAIAQVAPDATAFVHRNVLFSAQYLATGKASDTAQIQQQNLAWLQKLYAGLRPYASGQAYQNYVDADLVGWQAAYYGDNYAKLRQIKTKYDPTDVFHFAQSVEPA